MKNNNVSIYDDDYLKSKIYTIRGVQVMLDADLAEIYGYKTSSFNQQVKNNIERFDDEMRFQLTKEEHQKILISKLSISNDLLTNYKSIQYNEQTGLMSKILTSNNAKRGGTRKLPYAFTEQGIYMLMTVLKGDLAVDHRVSSITKVEDVMLYQNIINTLNSKIFSQKPLDNQKSFVFLQCLDRPGPRTLHYYALGG